MGPSCLSYLRIPELELERERVEVTPGKLGRGAKARWQIAVTATLL